MAPARLLSVRQASQYVLAAWSLPRIRMHELHTQSVQVARHAGHELARPRGARALLTEQDVVRAAVEWELIGQRLVHHRAHGVPIDRHGLSVKEATLARRFTGSQAPKPLLVLLPLLCFRAL